MADALTDTGRPRPAKAAADLKCLHMRAALPMPCCPNNNSKTNSHNNTTTNDMNNDDNNNDSNNHSDGLCLRRTARRAWRG